MKNLFNEITWKQYCGVSIAAIIIYYIFIGWKYYRLELQNLFTLLNNKISGSKGEFSVLEYPAKVDEAQQQTPGAMPKGEAYSQELPFTGTGNDLARELKQCIEEAADEPFAPALLIPKLRKILNDYPDVALSKDREKINALVVSECENTGTALLSESEVDMWWSA
jgi:hypothetical protein